MIIRYCSVAVLAGALALMGAPAGHAADVPVEGTVTITTGREAGAPPGVGMVHAVRRVPGGTILYYSYGFPEGTPAADVDFLRLRPQLTPQDRYGGPGAIFATPQLIDVPGRKVYTTLVGADGVRALCSPVDAVAKEAGHAYVLYTVMPELPDSVTAVDVSIGFGDVVRDVPVGEGPLTPALPADRPIDLGAGWPEVDLAAIGAAPQPELSVYPMTLAESDLEQTVVTREQPEQVSVDLAADVLFAVDEARLTGAARAKLQEAARTVNERAANGRIAIVGHTDNSGTGAYNDDLSRRRAEAVAAALRPLVTVPGVSLTVEGRGEREPVADNGTEAGRKKNRRVSVVIVPKAG